MTGPRSVMKSNLKLIPNVYLRKSGTAIRDDIDFLNRVRGREAVYKLLELMHVPPDNRRYDDQEVRRLIRQGRLTQEQHNSLKWGQRCDFCHMIPSGVNFQGKVEFRCDRPDCNEESYVCKKAVAAAHNY